MKTESTNLQQQALFVIFFALFTALLTACGSNFSGTGNNAPGSGSGGGSGGGGSVGVVDACPSGNLYTFQNNNSYPIWLAEAYQGGGNLNTNIIQPPNGNWEMTANSSFSLCMPPQWSGRFWPRAECDFNTPYSHDPGYKSCTAASQCSSGHICMGGKCLLDCTTGSTPFCQSAQGLGNPNSICVKSTEPGAAQFCGYPQGIVCKTGDCQGLYQCYGQWDNKVGKYAGQTPVSLFEPTSNSATSVNYDVSLVSGYNTEIKVTPSPNSCSATGCVSDLNKSCPANLQMTEAPTTTASSIPCGTGKYCQSGVCSNNNTCVIGCNDPGDQCSTSNAPSNLMCNTSVPSGDGSTYADMYTVKNISGKIPEGVGQTMISGNSGTPICWGDADCTPTETCAMGLISNFPSKIGICIGIPQQPKFIQPQIGCMQQNDVGGSCGNYTTVGFPNGVGYTCVAAATGAANNLACVPAFNPAAVGLGQLETSSDGNNTTFFSGVGGLLNPLWRTAATQAGNGTPWYETFSNACPRTYGWQYDDHAGGFSCTSSGQNVNMTIVFGPNQTTTSPLPSAASTTTPATKTAGKTSTSK